MKRAPQAPDVLAEAEQGRKIPGAPGVARATYSAAGASLERVSKRSPAPPRASAHDPRDNHRLDAQRVSHQDLRGARTCEGATFRGPFTPSPTQGRCAPQAFSALGNTPHGASGAGFLRPATSRTTQPLPRANAR